MLIERWDPFREIADLQREVNRSFEGAGPRRRQAREAEDEACAWTPTVDVFERGAEVGLRVELPGLEKDDIQIQIEHGVLTIRGEKKAQVGDDATFSRVESSYGAFCRSFAIPDSLDPDKVAAAFRNGVLTLTIGRREEALPKKVDVRIQ